MPRQKAIEIPFPVRGLHRSAGHDKTPEGHTQEMTNVRAHDSIQDRVRGGRRPGLQKWHDEQICDGFIQALAKGVLHRADLEIENTTFYAQGSPGTSLTFNMFDVNGQVIQSFSVPDTEDHEFFGGDDQGFFTLTPDRSRLIRWSLPNSPEAAQQWDHQLDPDEFDPSIAHIAIDPLRSRVYVVYDNEPFLTALHLGTGQQIWQRRLTGNAPGSGTPRQNRVRIARETGHVYVVSVVGFEADTVAEQTIEHDGSEFTLHQYEFIEADDFDDPVLVDFLQTLEWSSGDAGVEQSRTFRFPVFLTQPDSSGDIILTIEVVEFDAASDVSLSFVAGYLTPKIIGSELVVETESISSTVAESVPEAGEEVEIAIPTPHDDFLDEPFASYEFPIVLAIDVSGFVGSTAGTLRWRLKSVEVPDPLMPPDPNSDCGLPSDPTAAESASYEVLYVSIGDRDRSIDMYDAVITDGAFGLAGTSFGEATNTWFFVRAWANGTMTITGDKGPASGSFDQLRITMSSYTGEFHCSNSDVAEPSGETVLDDGFLNPPTGEFTRSGSVTEGEWVGVRFTGMALQEAVENQVLFTISDVSIAE